MVLPSMRRRKQLLLGVLLTKIVPHPLRNKSAYVDQSHEDILFAGGTQASV